MQPLETGVVKEILVEDGQAVRAGDVLVTFDPTAPAAERDRLAADLMAARLDAARLKAALDAGDPQAAFVPPADVAPDLVQVHRALLASAVDEHKARIAGLGSEIDRRRAGTEQINENHSVSAPTCQGGQG